MQRNRLQSVERGRQNGSRRQEKSLQKRKKPIADQAQYPYPQRVARRHLFSVTAAAQQREASGEKERKRFRFRALCVCFEHTTHANKKKKESRRRISDIETQKAEKRKKLSTLQAA
jgi:hypothetical protein